MGAKAPCGPSIPAAGSWLSGVPNCLAPWQHQWRQPVECNFPPVGSAWSSNRSSVPWSDHALASLLWTYMAGLAHRLPVFDQVQNGWCCGPYLEPSLVGPFHQQILGRHCFRILVGNGKPGFDAHHAANREVALGKRSWDLEMADKHSCHFWSLPNFLTCVGSHVKNSCYGQARKHGTCDFGLFPCS